MLTSVAYRPGRVPATQQQFSPVCLPHTIFTAYAKRPWGGTGTSANFSRSGCVSRAALERVCLLAISTSAKGLWGDQRHAELFVFAIWSAPSCSKTCLMQCPSPKDERDSDHRVGEDRRSPD